MRVSTHGQGLAWFESSMGTKGGSTLAFFISFSRCWTEEEEGRVRLKSCPHSYIKKMESDSLLKYFVDEDP